MKIARLLLTIVLLLLAIFGFGAAAQAAPRSPAVPLYTNCGPASPAPFYNGIHVVVTNTTLGQVMLDTTFPVQNNFQTRFQLFGSGNSTDDYQVTAFAFATNPTTQNLNLIGAVNLHC